LSRRLERIFELADGQTSVGTEISVTHTAASPLGAKVEATARIERIDGRKVIFSVSASEGSGEIGHGTHTRFVVDADRFIAKAKRAY
jgi:predicted thioesterase